MPTIHRFIVKFNKVCECIFVWSGKNLRQLQTAGNKSFLGAIFASFKRPPEKNLAPIFLVLHFCGPRDLK